MSVELNHFQQMSWFSSNLLKNTITKNSVLLPRIDVLASAPNLNIYLYIFSPYVNTSFISQVVPSSMFLSCRILSNEILWRDLTIC
jgi:hypothetical protein